jgi:hypothetical protein
MSLRALLLAVAIALPGAPAFADAILDGLKTLPGNVEDVRVGGTWDENGKNGIYRVIISRSGGDAVMARLFVQWVSYDDTGGAKVENTIEIKEFAELKVDIVDFTSESDGDGLSVFLQTLNPNGESDQNYELFVTSPTQYRFGPASN